MDEKGTEAIKRSFPTRGCSRIGQSIWRMACADAFFARTCPVCRRAGVAADAYSTAFAQRIRTLV